MSKAVKPAVDEAWAEVQSASVKHTDGTTWLHAGVILALWTIATAGVTVFKILSNGQGDTLERELLIDVDHGVARDAERERERERERQPGARRQHCVANANLQDAVELAVARLGRAAVELAQHEVRQRRSPNVGDTHWFYQIAGIGSRMRAK